MTEPASSAGRELESQDPVPSPVLAGSTARPSFRRRRVALPGEVAGLRAELVAFAGVSGATLEAQADIALAVSEACTNIVMHAYVDASKAGPMTVEARSVNGEISVTVSDEGRGMVPRTDSPGVGLGLALIARLARRMEVSDDGATPGTTVRMAFALA